MKLILTDRYAEILFLVNGLIVLLFFYSRKKKKERAITFGNYETLKKISGRDFLKASNILLLTRMLALTVLIVGISSPVIVEESRRSEHDYVLAIDSSASMSNTDIEPNRLDAAKTFGRQFLNGLGNESRVGVISFAGEVRKEQEMTDDLSSAKASVSGIEMGGTAGTAIGNAVNTASSMLLQSNKSRIVLVTDGENNVGSSINDSLAMAENQNVSIYPIGLGRAEEGETSYQVINGENVSRTVYPNIDQENLQYMANRTGGNATFVSNRSGLRSAFVELGVSEVENDISPYFIWLAAILLIFEWVVRTTKFEVLP